MKIFRPTRTNHKTQGFGENKACVNPQGQVKTKVNGVCPLGYFDLYKSMGLIGHNGEDWALWYGEPVYFPVEEGEYWIKTEVDNNGGVGVDAISHDLIDGNYVKFKFWHLKSVAVHDTQTVRAGDLIGFGDSTGLSSGDHLHWSMKYCDRQGNPLNKYNGYVGATDFSPYFENEFILDVLQLKEKTLSLVDQLRKLIFQLQLLVIKHVT